MCSQLRFELNLKNYTHFLFPEKELEEKRIEKSKSKAVDVSPEFQKLVTEKLEYVKIQILLSHYYNFYLTEES